MNKKDFCYGTLNQILVMTDYLEDQKSNKAGFVKYQTIKGLKAIRCHTKKQKQTNNSLSNTQ